MLDAAGLVGAAAQSVLASTATSLTLAQVQRAHRELRAAAAQLDAALLHTTRLMLERDDSPRSGPRTVAWMTHTLHTGAGQARADVAAAQATDPVSGTLPQLGAALAAGTVVRQHVDVAVRALRQLPTGMVSERGDEVDVLVTSHAQTFSPVDAGTLAKHLVMTVTKDRLEAFADDAPERRSLTYRTDPTGMVRIEGQLPSEAGAAVVAVLDHLTSPDRHLPGEGGGADGEDAAVDRRTLVQRGADALEEMARLATAQLRLDAPHLEPARVVVHCTAEQLTHPDAAEPCRLDDAAEEELAAAHRSPGPATDELLGPIAARALQRHACDAVLERVVLDRTGAVLRMESFGRLANRAQRRALAARDGGCAWPGCAAPASWTEAHHVVWWSRGGPTVLENLVLLCSRHHTEIHREHWVIVMRDGVPWFIPPPWVDPDQVPLRNSLHVAIQRTRRAAQRLVMGQSLDDDDLGDPPGLSDP